MKAARPANGAPAPKPTLVLTIPGGLEPFPTATAAAPIGFSAIEIADAAPRGIGQELRDRGHIVALADSLDLALVASSNNHGWGQAAAAWTLVRVPGWRALPPDSLGRRIEARIHEEGRRATRVIERPLVPTHGSAAALALTVPVAAWRTLAADSAAERVAWILWIWVGFLLTERVSRGAHRGARYAA